MPETFLSEPPQTAERDAMYEGDLEGSGYVWNLSGVWGYQPSFYRDLIGFGRNAGALGDLSMREMAVLASALASEMGDGYCSLAWGRRLAEAADADLAADILNGGGGTTDADRALTAWARQMVRDPNRTTPEHVDALRAAGYTDRQIFAITVFVGVRIGFSTINDALGAAPDAGLRDDVPAQVAAAVTYGR